MSYTPFGVNEALNKSTLEDRLDEIDATISNNKVSEVWESDGGAVAMEADDDGNIGIATDEPKALLHILGGGTPGTPSLSGSTLFTLQQTGATNNNASLSIIAGNVGLSNLFFGDTDDEDDGIIRYVHSSQSMAFHAAASEVMRLLGGNLGVGTTAPGQIIDANAGSGNMIADGYDNHPSVAAVKEEITDVPNVLSTLTSTPPKTFKRKPFVSADELRSHAIKTHLAEWMAEFGGEVVDGELTGDDYRGGKLKGIKNAGLLAVVDAEADRLRLARKDEHKWKREFSGPVLDEPGWTSLPNVVIKNEAGEITGWNLESYVACLHKSIIEQAVIIGDLTDRLEALEAARG